MRVLSTAGVPITTSLPLRWAQGDNDSRLLVAITSLSIFRLLMAVFLFKTERISTCNLDEIEDN